MTTKRRWMAALGLILILLPACGGGGEGAPPNAEQARTEIEALLREYAPKLAEAYSSGNIELLRPLAAERQLAALEKRVRDLMERGLVLQAELDKLQIETVDLWSPTNAYLTTLETWDLRYYSVAADELNVDALVSEELDRTDRVRYQVTWAEGRWLILHREIAAPSEGS